VEIISASCLTVCVELQTMTLEPVPKLAKIGDSALAASGRAKNVIPALVKAIGNLCFYDWAGLSDLTFERGCRF
jgi:hypothetical protein